jgi:hypothetical protein
VNGPSNAALAAHLDMPLGVGVDQRADHALVGHALPLGVPLEEVDAPPAQRQRDLDRVLAPQQLFGRRQEVPERPVANIVHLAQIVDVLCLGAAHRVP